MTTPTVPTSPTRTPSARLLGAIRPPAIALGCLLAGALPAIADAQPMSPAVWSGPLYTVADGPLCGGHVALLTSPRGPGTASIQVTGGFFGISGTTAHCSVGVSVHWRNLDTGAHGVEHGRVAGLMIPSAPTQVMFAEIHPGPGAVELRMEPDRPHRPIDPTRLQVP
ncbi:hypothetical protein [Rhodococcus sp. Q]|uniref:hypothetical protein n=1 Tax=Rhodococcus sp. Q TaxID=2502252 RepID=UPI0010F859A8|nr:hypothetical protein [Rhodococcus sp. Q]